MVFGAVTANGNDVKLELPCALDDFLESQGLLPKSVVVELNQQAVSPSEFSGVQLPDGDRLEIIKVVAGG